MKVGISRNGPLIFAEHITTCVIWDFLRQSPAHQQSMHWCDIIDKHRGAPCWNATHRQWVRRTLVSTAQNFETKRYEHWNQSKETWKIYLLPWSRIFRHIWRWYTTVHHKYNNELWDGVDILSEHNRSVHSHTINQRYRKQALIPFGFVISIVVGTTTCEEWTNVRNEQPSYACL